MAQLIPCICDRCHKQGGQLSKQANGNYWCLQCELMIDYIPVADLREVIAELDHKRSKYAHQIKEATYRSFAYFEAKAKEQATYDAMITIRALLDQEADHE